MAHLEHVHEHSLAESRAAKLAGERWPGGTSTFAETVALGTLSFNQFAHTEAELLVLIESAFDTLHLVASPTNAERPVIPRHGLHAFLLDLRSHYRDVPYHNFRHAFHVFQSAYAFVMMGQRSKMFSRVELLALLLGALVHDIDHPGLNNTFQNGTMSTLAVRYHFDSPLERHHLALGTFLFHKHRLLEHMEAADVALFRDLVKAMLEATDLKRHRHTLEELQSIVELGPAWPHSDHARLWVLVGLMKAADISVEARPDRELVEPFVSGVYAEFDAQARLEQQLGLRDTVTALDRHHEQSQFLHDVCIPLYVRLAQLMPEFADIVARLRTVHDHEASLSGAPSA